MPTCPNGHQSAADDWCEVCGHRMSGTPMPSGHMPPPPPPPPMPGGPGAPGPGGYGGPPPPPGAPPPGAPSSGYGYPAPPQPDGGYQPEVCPQCRTPREAQAPFCEECRYNFLTQQPTSYAPPPPGQGGFPPPPGPPQPQGQPPLGHQGPPSQGQPLPPHGQQPPHQTHGGDYQASRPSQINRPAEPLSPSEPHQPSGPAFGGGEDDWPLAPPQASAGAAPPPPPAPAPPQQQGYGYGYPQAPQPPAPPAPSYGNEAYPGPGAPPPPGPPGPYGQGGGHTPPPPAGPGNWMALVGPDRDYFTAMMHRSGPEAAGLNLPAYSPEQQLPLNGQQITIGRRRHSTGEAPDIDLGRAPEDPGVSHQHAVLVQQPDGGWAVVDQDSTNGTTINGGEEPIQPYVPIPLQDGDRVHVGAWTTITVRRG